MLEVQSRWTQHHNHGVSGDKMTLFADQVYHNHGHIEAILVWEFSNEIDTYDIPLLFRDFEGM